MLLRRINGKDTFIFALDCKFETFQAESYHDKRKRGVLEENTEEHNSFNKVLKGNKELKARTDSFRNQYKMRQDSKCFKYFGDKQQRSICYSN